MKFVYKHLRLLWRYIVISWKNGTEYRKDFIVTLIDFFVMTVLTIIFWRAILGTLESIGSWGFSELIVLGIFGNTAWAFSDFFAGAWMLPEKIVEGTIDKYLSKPVNSLFAIVMEEIQIDEVLKGGVASILLGAILLIGGIIKTQALNVVLSLVVLLLGVVLISLVRIFISLLTFWIGESSGINKLVHLEDFRLERFPVDIYSIRFRQVFIYGIPIAFLATYPARIFLGKELNQWLIVSIGLALVFVWGAIVALVWWRGVKHYEATGG